MQGSRAPKRSVTGRVLSLVLLLVSGLAVPSAVAEQAPLPRPKPSGASADYLNPDDFAALKKAMTEAKKDDWRDALAIARRLDDPVATKLVEWAYLRDRSADAPFERVRAFLDANPDWPSRRLMRIRAEDQMPDTLPPGEVISWFEEDGPFSGYGMLLLTQAYFKTGQEAKAIETLRRGWREYDFDPRSEKTLRTQYRKHLRKVDHEVRMERLLWKRRFSAAKRLKPYVGTGRQRLADARMALAAMRGGVDGKIDRVPSEFAEDPGLLYERIRWRRRKGRDEQTWDLIKQAPRDPELMVFPDRWWVEKHLQARKALRAGRPQLAYDLTIGHGMSEGVGFAQAEFLAGFIALRMLKKPDVAYRHFETLEAGVTTPISKSRALYWMGRAADAQGEDALAQAHYHEAGAFPITFYGQLALEKIKGGDPYLRLPAGVPPAEDLRKPFFDAEVTHAAKIAGDLGIDWIIRAFFYHLKDEAKSTSDFVLIAELANAIGRPDMGVRAAKEGMQNGERRLINEAYPVVDFAPAVDHPYQPERAMVLGLSRQESEFNPKAISHANARGLMQMIPATARSTARAMGLPFETSWLTERPDYNAQLGQYHLGQLLERFDGSYIFTAAAYNAGPHRIPQWIEANGDPRTGSVDPIDWIEQIPFGETRNYVQRVLENTAVYRNRLTGKDVALRLSQDLRATGRPDTAYRMDETRTLFASPRPLPFKRADAPGPDDAVQTAQAESAVQDGAEVSGQAPASETSEPSAPVTAAVAPGETQDPAPAASIPSRPGLVPVPATLPRVPPNRVNPQRTDSPITAPSPVAGARVVVDLPETPADYLPPSGGTDAGTTEKGTRRVANQVRMWMPPDRCRMFVVGEDGVGRCVAFYDEGEKPRD